MAIIGGNAIIQTQTGFQHINEYDGTPAITNNGFNELKVKKTTYSGQFVRIDLWAFCDPIFAASDTKAKGTMYVRCANLGNGPQICYPWLRCWTECIGDPAKESLNSPGVFSFRELRKRGNVILPGGDMTYHHSDKRTCDKGAYQRGRDFGLQYKTCRNERPPLDVERMLFDDPNKFKAFILGWQDTNCDVSLDMWIYKFVVKNKKLAYDIQFLFNYFGVPTAMNDYRSVQFGNDNWLVTWCKYKKPYFPYKIFKHNGLMHNLIRHWRPLDTEKEDCPQVEWYDVSIRNNAAKFFAAPFWMEF